MDKIKRLKMDIADARALETAVAMQVQNKADIDFIALMTDVDIIAEDEEMEVGNDSL